LVFFLDTSKQGVGATLGHFCNLWLSRWFSESIDGGADACQWYFLFFLEDATLGTIFNLVALGIYDKLAGMLRFPKMGDYGGDQPDVVIWAFQMFVWLFILTIGKSLLTLLFIAYKYGLNDFISGAFGSLKPHPEMELLLVMIVIPLVCNSISFWVTDTFLKKKSNTFMEGAVPLRSGDPRDSASATLIDPSSSLSSSSSPRQASYVRVRNMYDATGDDDFLHSGGHSSNGDSHKFLPGWLRNKLNSSPTSVPARSALDEADAEDWRL